MMRHLCNFCHYAASECDKCCSPPNLTWGNTETECDPCNICHYPTYSGLMSNLAYTADQIRAAEAPLLDAQEHPDQLMQAAAHQVFRVARELAAKGRVVLLVGKGGNGGDALYAGAELAMSGCKVDAWLAFDTAQSLSLIHISEPTRRS